MMVRRASLLVALISTACLSLGSQDRARDLLKQEVKESALQEEPITEGVARLSETTDLAYCIERRIKPSLTAPLKRDPQFSASVQSRTVADVLDWFVSLDRGYGWSRDDGTVNLFPVETAGDANYVMNRTIPELRFANAKDAWDAISAIEHQLPGGPQGIALLQAGGPALNFPKPWNETFQNITVRHAFNLIARQFGPTWGWEFNGATEFQMITFHERFLSRASHRLKTGQAAPR